MNPSGQDNTAVGTGTTPPTPENNQTPNEAPTTLPPFEGAASLETTTETPSPETTTPVDQVVNPSPIEPASTASPVMSAEEQTVSELNKPIQETPEAQVAQDGTTSIPPDSAPSEPTAPEMSETSIEPEASTPTTSADAPDTQPSSETTSEAGTTAPVQNDISAEQITTGNNFETNTPVAVPINETSPAQEPESETNSEEKPLVGAEAVSQDLQTNTALNNIEPLDQNVAANQGKNTGKTSPSMANTILVILIILSALVLAASIIAFFFVN